MKYEKKTPRLIIKFVDSDTNQVLFETNDRTWLTIGDVLSDGAISSIMQNEWKNKPLPENLMVLVVAELELK